MRSLENILTRILEGILAACLFVIAATVVTLVGMRYLFNSSITGANEMITVLFVYTTALGAAIAVGRREHIAIGFATETLPERLRNLADSAGLLVVAILNGVMLFYSLVWIRVTGHYLMPSTGLPRYVAQTSVPLGCGLVVLFCLIRLLSAATCEQNSGRKHESPRADSHGRTP